MPIGSWYCCGKMCSRNYTWSWNYIPHILHFAIKPLDSSVFFGTTLTAIHRKMHQLRHTFVDMSFYIPPLHGLQCLSYPNKKTLLCGCALWTIHCLFSFVPTDIRLKITHCQSAFENDNFSFFRYEKAYCTIICRQDVEIGNLSNRKPLPLTHHYHP